MAHRDIQQSGISRRRLVQLAAGLAAGAGRIDAQTPRGDAAKFQAQGSTLTLENARLAMSWRVSGSHLAAVELVDRDLHRTITLSPDLFQLQLEGGRVLKSSEMTVADKPKSAQAPGNPKSSQKAGRRAGRELTAAFRDEQSGALVKWRAILLDNSRYVRQEITVGAGNQDLPLREIALWNFDAPGAKAVGTVKGSPVVAGSFFLGFEHPLSLTNVAESHVRCSLPRQLPVRAGQSMSCSSVIGTTPEGQLRRGFLDYVEDQRAHPFRTFLHYNSWYDLGYF